MFDVGSLESRLELDRTPFLTGLRAARMEGQRFERESFTATVDVNLDAANAERRLEEFEHGDHTLHSDFDLDTGAAMAKIELLKREAAGIGGGIGGGVGGVPGGGGGASSGGILGTGGFIRPSALLAGGVGAASFLPTVGASAAQGALGAGALGLGLGGAAAVGLAATVATAVPAITALKAAETAQLNYNKAVATYGKDSTEAKTALKSVKAAQDALVPSAQRVMDSIEGLKSRWGELSQPAQRQFFGILNDGIKEANHLMPMFADIAQQDIGAARTAIDHLLASMNTGDFSAFVHTMSNLFAEGIGPVERGVENILHVLGRIAVAVAPDVLRMLQGFASTTHQWERDTRNALDLQRHVHSTVQDFRAWFDVAASLGHLLSALFITNQQGAKTGRQELEAMSHQLDAWSRWIDHHHGEVTRFFGTLNDTFGLLVSSAGEIAKVVLPAFKPVADVIHTVVSDLNSLKVGNVSALTVLLGIMAGRSIVGKLGIGAAAAGTAVGTGEAAAGGAAGGGLLTQILARAGGPVGLGARGAGIVGGLGIAAAIGTEQSITTGGGVLDTLKGHPKGDVQAQVAEWMGEFRSGIADGIKRDRSLQAAIRGATIGELHDIRGESIAAARDLGTNNARVLGGAMQHEGQREARQTARMAQDQIDALKLGVRMADAVGEGKGDVRKVLKDYENSFEKLPPSAQDAAVKSAKVELDALQQMGGITKKEERQTLNDLEDMQAQSQRKQRQKWDQFGRVTNRLVGGWFGSMANTVDTILGNKGITGMVNQLLSGVSSQDKLKWNATTVGHIAGTLSGFLSGGQRGGFTGGFSSFDDRMIAVRGGEAILRGEDHVPIVSAALQRSYGITLGDLFNRTGANTRGMGHASGGFVDLWGKGMAHFARGGVAPPPGGWANMQPEIIALAQRMVQNFGGLVSSGYRAGDPGFHGRGLAADIVPSDWGGATRYANQIGSQLLEGIHQGPPGSNVSWDSGSRVSPSFWGAATWAEHVSHIHMAVSQMIGKAVGGAMAQLPRILIHGPKGAIHDGLQSTADMSRKAANAYLRRHLQAPVTDISAHGTGTLSPEEFLAVARRAMAVTGHREFSPGGLLSLAQQESGLRINPPPPHDINWPNNPSMGLMQVTEDTFRAYHESGTSRNIIDPLANIASSINYQAARYGHQVTSSPYQRGGWVGWNAAGLDAMVNGPVMFGAGEKGRERVRVEPVSANRPPEIPQIIVKGDIVSDYKDPVVAVLGSREFPLAVRREISGDRAHSRQLARMRR